MRSEGNPCFFVFATRRSKEVRLLYHSAKRRSSSRLMMFIIALIIFIFGLGLNLSVGASDISIIDSLKYLLYGTVQRNSSSSLLFAFPAH